MPERAVPSQSASRFDPDWCIRPGETLREWREENGGLSAGKKDVSDDA